MIEIFIGLVLGALLTYGIYSLISGRSRRSKTQHQSTVLLQQIRSVCKLISVEGDFAEIYRFENRKSHFGKLFSTKKKALIVINAKAQIGFDFKKIRIRADENKKTIYLQDFPQPEILSIEPDLEFYDIRNDLFNAFTPDDLTTLNKEAKAHIREKIPGSGLMESARREAIETLLLMEKLVETIGWRLDYSALELNSAQALQLEQERKELKE